MVGAGQVAHVQKGLGQVINSRGGGGLSQVVQSLEVWVRRLMVQGYLQFIYSDYGEDMKVGPGDLQVVGNQFVIFSFAQAPICRRGDCPPPPSCPRGLDCRPTDGRCDPGMSGSNPCHECLPAGQYISRGFFSTQYPKIETDIPTAFL